MKRKNSSLKLTSNANSLSAAAGAVGVMLAASQEADAGIQHLVLNFDFDRPAATVEGSLPFFSNNSTAALLVNGTSLLGFAKIGMRGARSFASGTSGYFQVYFSITNPATNVVRLATNSASAALWRQLSSGSVLSDNAVPAPQDIGFDLVKSVSTNSFSPNPLGASWAAPTETLGTESTYVSGTVNGFIGFYFGTYPGALYGWAQIDLKYDSDGILSGYTLVDLAFSEVPGQSLLVGQGSAIPEPSAVGGGLGLLALGAAGLRERRRRRLSKSTQTTGSELS